VDGFCITGNNSYHVITYNLDSDAASVVIDGFVVERGDANGGVTEQDPDGAAPDNQGGAIQIRKPPSQVCVAGGPTIRNCIIRGNYAADHGAINDHGHTTEIRNCVFRNNLARKGAGLLVEHGSPLIINSYFVGNSVITETLPDQPPREGSALWLDRRANGTSGCDSNDPSAATVVNCLFERNGRPGSGFTLLQGGGVWIGSGATPSFADCDFERNVAHLGAAVFQKSSEGDPIVYDDCTFRINSANGLWSGAMYAGSRGVILSRCTFELNYAGSLGYGGAVYANGGALVWAESSDFVANMGVKGGAMGLQMASAELLNCTVAGNIGTGSPHGGGIFIEGSGETLTASNSIFYWNLSKSGGSTYDGADAQLHASSGATASVNDSDWKGNGPTCPNRDSNDNMDCDPDFVADPYCTGICGDDPLTTSTDESVDDSAGDAHLASGSKCIDAGDDAYVAGCIDIDWQARETNDPNTTDTGDGTAPIVDIGADEFCPPSSSCPDLCPEPE
jgi:hypothetical protein